MLMFLNKKKILIVFLILVLLLILGKNYLIEVVKHPSFRIHIINISKVVIPLKNNILKNSVDDQIASLKSSGSCVFCDLTNGSFKGSDLQNFNLRYANLKGADFSDTNVSGIAFYKSTYFLNGKLDKSLQDVNFSNANMVGVDLRNQDLTGTIFAGANLTRANLTGVDFRNKDLTGTVFAGADFTSANLTGVDFRNKDLNRTVFAGADLTRANLTGVDFRNKDLTGANLTGVDLSNKDLTGAILIYVNFSNANLNGVDLRNKDLTGSNLNGVDFSYKDLTGTNLTGVELSNTNLTGAIMKEAKKIKIRLKSSNNSNWLAINETQNLNVSRYDLNEDIQYIATKEGLLFEFNNDDSRLVLDLNNNAQFPFISEGENGLLGIASKNQLIYIAYTTKSDKGVFSLIVDEYSMNFSKVRNIMKIDDFGHGGYYGANLLFDSQGALYLSVGDGGSPNDAQNLNSLKGKILRIDLSEFKLDPEIIAYGIRVPWGVTIDSRDRMFILQCGYNSFEGAFLVNDLYSSTPVNLGWPVFEGGVRMQEGILNDDDVLAPIFQTHVRPGCLTAGVYLDNLDSLLIGDYFGTIRLLSENKNGDWNLIHQYKQKENIWGFGLDSKTKKIFTAPKNLELEIILDEINFNE
tara:strand:- start:218 stop:2122 length:1905 start_codon:yes stop_codon:yes gene_type:complete